MRKWMLCVMLLSVAILISGCVASPAAPPDSTDSPPRERVEQLTGDSGTYWLFQETRSNDTFYGIMRENGEVVAPANYTGYRPLRDDRLLVSEEQAAHFIVIDEQGRTVLDLLPPGLEGYDNWDYKPLDPTSYRAILQPEPNTAALFDLDGVRHGDVWNRMKFVEAETVLAENDEGLFQLDLEGQIVRQLGEVQTVASLFDDTRLLTKRQTFDGDLFGARDENDRVLLEETFGAVRFLSRDRLIGQSPTLDVDNPNSHAVIVDGTGKIICDRYTYVAFYLDSHTDPPYPYSYLAAAIATTAQDTGIVKTDWYLIDHDGNPVNETPFVRCCKTDSELVSFIDANNLTVTWSLETGKMVE